MAKMTKQRAKEFYATMYKIRRFEEEVFEFYKLGQMAGLAHLYIGEEAVAAGACAAIDKQDYIGSTHRGHGHLVARGADMGKMMAEILGKETIDLYNTSDTRGTSQSYGLNYQKTGKELMSQDEIAVMDGSKCIMQLRGVRPFFSDKFDITKHKQYPLLSDYDKKNEFDIEKYVKNRNKLRFKQNDMVDEVCDVGEIAE